ncbi:MAG: Mut7-C RNAse domain-containing protein [Candidatus Methylacidiphilaceae bacterium]
MTDRFDPEREELPEAARVRNRSSRFFGNGIKRVEFRFYAGLNDFLPRAKKQRSFPHSLLGNASVKDLIESQGVPHTEVDLILVDGRPVGFSHPVQHGDRISIYPKFESIEIASLALLRPRPVQEPRFVLDVHLGRLARYLRLLGFDCFYRNDLVDEELVKIASADQRILLTRDTGLLMRAAVTHGYWLREIEIHRQVLEVIRRFDLSRRVAPFTRCLLCNGRLQPTEKREIADQLPQRVANAFEKFVRCAECGKIYWKGSHYDRMARFVTRLYLDGKEAPNAGDGRD